MEKKQFSWIRGQALGAGSFGTVSLAVSKGDGSLFAVKSVELTSDKGMLEDLDNERRVLESLESPHVVRCLGGDESGGMRNIFLEYMPGGSVGDLMKKLGGKLDESLVRIYTREMLQGLEFLHRNGIVHCDVKVKNVLVGCDGVKLGDFGAAKRGKEMRGFKGSPLYMAPEVALQEEQGPASDIWSLGCTVLEMLTGQAPWSQFTGMMAAMYKIACSQEVPEVPSWVSGQGQDFLSKCLRRDASARFTAQELLSHPFVTGQVEEAEEEKPVPAPSPRSPLDFSMWENTNSSGPLPKLQLKKQEEETNPTTEGKWIVVRSPQGQSGFHSAFDHLSNFDEDEGAEEQPAAEPSPPAKQEPAPSTSDSQTEPEQPTTSQPEAESEACTEQAEVCSEVERPGFTGSLIQRPRSTRRIQQHPSLNQRSRRNRPKFKRIKLVIGRIYLPLSASSNKILRKSLGNSNPVLSVCCNVFV